MSHIYMIIGRNGDLSLSDIVRDLKSFTPYAAKLSEAEWGELLEMVCTYLLPEEEKQIQYIYPRLHCG